jgi:resuscitation-promoting factor RpfB
MVPNKSDNQTALVQMPPPKVGLSPGQKTAVIIGSAAMALLLVCCVGSALTGLFADEPRPAAQPADPQPRSGADAPAAAAAPPTTAAPIATTAPPTGQHTAETVVEEEEIAFTTKRVNDSSLPKGTTKVRTQGVPGLKRITYEVTYADGVETGRTKVREVVVRKPVTKVVAVGTKQPRCDPNYAGACVPIASDVDCAGGSGNGPAYVEGPVRVVGRDIYDLDDDNDGIGCE